MNPERVKALSTDIFDEIKKHYMQGPVEPARVYEALNALALVVEIVLEGTNHDPDAQDFFAECLNNQQLVNLNIEIMQ